MMSKLPCQSVMKVSGLIYNYLIFSRFSTLNAAVEAIFSLIAGSITIPSLE